jgi:hypothetical protein
MRAVGAITCTFPSCTCQTSYQMPGDRSSGLTDNCFHMRSISSIVHLPVARWCHWPPRPLSAKNVITSKFYGTLCSQSERGKPARIVHIAARDVHEDVECDGIPPFAQNKALGSPLARVVVQFESSDWRWSSHIILGWKSKSTVRNLQSRDLQIGSPAR